MLADQEHRTVSEQVAPESLRDSSVSDPVVFYADDSDDEDFDQVPIASINQLVINGTIRPDTRVWTSGMDGWSSYSDAEEYITQLSLKQDDGIQAEGKLVVSTADPTTVDSVAAADNASGLSGSKVPMDPAVGNVAHAGPNIDASFNVNSKSTAESTVLSSSLLSTWRCAWCTCHLKAVSRQWCSCLWAATVPRGYSLRLGPVWRKALPLPWGPCRPRQR